jgi:hypothetical protein
MAAITKRFVRRGAASVQGSSPDRHILIVTDDFDMGVHGIGTVLPQPNRVDRRIDLVE